MDTTDLSLIGQARRELQLSQRAFAELVGISSRTIQRHPRSHGLSLTSHYAALIKRLHPKNPELARRIAESIGKTLPELGIQLPPPPPLPSPPPPAPPAPPLARREHADSVVSAAADVLQVTPQSARPIVAAVFERALELGVDLPSLAKLVAKPPGSKTGSKAG